MLKLYLSSFKEIQTKPTLLKNNKAKAEFRSCIWLYGGNSRLFRKMHGLSAFSLPPALTSGGANEHFLAVVFLSVLTAHYIFSDAIFCACVVQVMLTSKITSSCAVKCKKFSFITVLQKARQLASRSRGNPPKEILHRRRGCGTNTSAETIPGSSFTSSVFRLKTFQPAFRKE